LKLRHDPSQCRKAGWQTLPTPPSPPILSLMDDTPHRRQPADWDPPMPSEAELLAALARSEADIAAGRVVPASVVHEALRTAIERIEAQRMPRHKTGGRR